MIIACQKCNKKFNVDQNLIPEKGRLLQCNSCNHKWFFINEIPVKTIKSSINESIEIFENKKSNENNSIDDDSKTNIQNINILPEEEIVKKTKIKKKNKFLSLVVVFIISFGTLIILLDTFKYPLSKIAPSLEFLLYNLYESIKDIALFINDLI